MIETYDNILGAFKMAIAKGVELLYVIAEVDRDERWLQSAHMQDLDRLSRHMGYESAMDVAIDVELDERRHDDVERYEEF